MVTEGDCSGLARDLDHLLSQLTSISVPADAQRIWNEIEATSRSLANELRVKDDPEDRHTILGKTSLPETLTLLLKSALGGSSTPSTVHQSSVFEILRVSANLCMDHDENRGHLLEAGLPQTIVSLLEGYADLIPADLHPNPLPLSIAELKVVRTAIGVLLNASVSYEPVKSRLTSLEVGMTLMRLSAAIYPLGAWITQAQHGVVSDQETEISEDIILESWTLRSSLSNWAWRAILELKDDSRQIFGPDVLPVITPALNSFIPPHPTPTPSSPFFKISETRNTLIQTDFDALEESCTLLESLTLDVEDVRLSLARGSNFPAEHGGISCFSSMLDFIEKGTYPSVWYSSGLAEAEIKRKENVFDICKAAVIKAVVEVAGEDKNEDVLWDESEEGKPGGEFIWRMTSWLRGFVKNEAVESSLPNGPLNGVSERGEAPSRDDLVICASLSLANLARRETHATVLLSPPYTLASLLSSAAFLSPSTDIKVKHGVVGLLKHIAQSSGQSPTNRTVLGEAGVIQRLASSGIWSERSDAMTEIVQAGAIGVVKHMCNGNSDNAATFALASPDGLLTPLSQILALVQHSDTVAIKSEGTRALVNAIKSLWSNGSSNHLVRGSQKYQEQSKRRQEAMSAVIIPPCVEALAMLIARSAKYPILINEGVVALTLLTTHLEGGLNVAESIVSVLPPDVSSAGLASASSELESPAVASSVDQGRFPAPRRALDMLISVLKNTNLAVSETSTGSRPVVFPVEVRANVCSLLAHVGKNKSGGEAIEKIREATRPVLESLANDANMSQPQAKEALLGTAAKKALESWS